jgi:FkbM family methyltransferase
MYIKKIIKYLNYYRDYYIKLYRKDFHTVQFHKWKRIKGDETLRLNYPLNTTSVVFDVGGYKGDWAKKIFDKYKCCVFIFEPVEQCYKNMEELFKSNNLIRVYGFGLLDETGVKNIYLDTDGTSLCKESDEKETIQVKDINKFMIENNIDKIDLIKINIEGAEYKLLKRMISCEIVQRCTDIQIQFHRCVENYEQEYLKIKTELLKTHDLTYEFPFLWENWRKKSCH